MSSARTRCTRVALARRLSDRTDGALQPEFIAAVAAGARGSKDAGLGATCNNPFRSIVVRAVEVVYAFDEALRIIDVLPRAGGIPSRD